MNKNSLAIDLLQYLSKHFPSAKQYSINEFLKERREDKEEIVLIIKGLMNNSFIHSIDNLEASINDLDNVDIKTNITNAGENYIKSFFETQSHKSNIKFNTNKDIIAILLTILSLGFAVYSWAVQAGKDTQIQTMKETINKQIKTIDSTNVILDSLRKKI
jgi:hypothetical protein